MQASIKSGKLVALISFIGGTIIFCLFYLTSDSTLLFLGYGYAFLIGLVNLGILVTLLTGAYRNASLRRNAFKTCFMMLLNIPVLVLYCYFSVILLNTMRVTFINTTQNEFTQIKITGCEPCQINKLAPGESITVWIKITGDCALDIDYIVNGIPQHETVAGYCTNDMGQKITFNIGTNQERVF